MPMSDSTTAYFDDVIARAATAPVIHRQAWVEAEPAKCRQNCEGFAKCFEGYAVVRGWLVIGGHLCIPHSVLRNTVTGSLIDITPDPSGSRIPFVEHRRSDADFQILRSGRDGGYLHPPMSPVDLATAPALLSSDLS
jgi:hypothetical protein